MTATELIAEFFLVQGYAVVKSKYVKDRYWVGRGNDVSIRNFMSVEVKGNIVYTWRSKRFPTDSNCEGSFNLNDPGSLMAVLEWGRQRGI